MCAIFSTKSVSRRNKMKNHRIQNLRPQKKVSWICNSVVEYEIQSQRVVLTSSFAYLNLWFEWFLHSRESRLWVASVALFQAETPNDWLTDWMIRNARQQKESKHPFISKYNQIARCSYSSFFFVLLRLTSSNLLCLLHCSVVHHCWIFVSCCLSFDFPCILPSNFEYTQHRNTELTNKSKAEKNKRHSLI